MNQGLLSPLSYFFARFVAREYCLAEDDLAVISAALVSECNQRGESCIDLSKLAGKPFFEKEPGIDSRIPQAPGFDDWVGDLSGQACIGKADEIAPLILESPRLYLGRFWHYEKQVQQAILKRLQWSDDIDERQLAQGLNRLFPVKPDKAAPDWQKLACALAVGRQFAIVSGGPGTGKTTTVVKILALLIEQNLDQRIGLAAPTGKAATRMMESIRERKTEISVDAEIRDKIPDEACTLHRLLEYDGRGFGIDQNNPLPLDCLVIDEASMIDLPLMSRILTALPDAARLILIGDRDQLASVEAGNVLADLTGNGQEIVYSPSIAQKLTDLGSSGPCQISTDQHAPGIANSIALLRKSYRFDSSGSIGKLAALVNRGEARQAIILLESDSLDHVEWHEPDNNEIATEVIKKAVDHYQSYLLAHSPDQALEYFDRFRILCAIQQGPTGVIECNRRIEERLFPKRNHGESTVFHGKAVMITVNDYESGLFNGDVGLFWKDQDGRVRAWFRNAGDDIRDFPIHALPEYVPAWAMTVHKSQGSEFEKVMLILPGEKSTSVVCRELIYTGITRCKNSILIHSNRKVFIRGVERKLSRSSGLAEKLGWPDSRCSFTR